MRVVVITPPKPFVTIDEAALHVGMGDDLDRLQLERLVAAACRHLEPTRCWLGRAFGEQELELRLSRYEMDGCASVRLPFPDTLSLVSIVYLSADGTEVTASLDDVELIGNEIVPVDRWPWENGSMRREAVRIRYRAGYDTVPDDIKTAVLGMVADMFHFPESVIEGSVSAVRIPTSVENLLADHRVYC